MSLESVVTGGRVTYLDLLVYDPVRARVELRTVDPDAPEVPLRSVVFTAVHDYAEEPFDPALPRDPSVLESLIGLDVHAGGAGTLYVVHTDEREVSFLRRRGTRSSGPRRKGRLVGSREPAA